MNDSFNHDVVDQITVGTVGPPGHRVFLLQSLAAGEWVTLKVEKMQVRALADSIQQILADLPQPGPLPDPDFHELESRWIVGELGLAYDADSDRLLIMAEELVFVDEDADDEEADPDPAVARFTITREQAAALAIRSRLLVEAGRPPCPVCGYPLEPSGHSCPRLNGNRPPAR